MCTLFPTPQYVKRIQEGKKLFCWEIDYISSAFASTSRKACVRNEPDGIALQRPLSPEELLFSWLHEVVPTPTKVRDFYTESQIIFISFKYGTRFLRFQNYAGKSSSYVR